MLLNVVRYCLNLMDFYSDVLFGLSLSVVLGWGHWLCALAVCFVITSYALSCMSLCVFYTRVQKQKDLGDPRYLHTAEFMEQNLGLVVLLTSLGGFYSTLQLLSSKIVYTLYFSLYLTEAL